MRGKTADEVANLSDQMYAELVRGSAQPQRPQTPAAAAAQTQYNATNATAPVAPDNTLWITDPAAAAQQYAAYINATQVNPAMASLAAQLGSTSREVVRQRYADEFRKWGPEIDLYINQTSPEYRTVENIERILGMVRGNHIDEISAERVEREIQRRMEAGAILRPGTAPAAAPNGALPNGAVDLKNAGLPPEYSRVLEHYRITPQVLDEFLLKTSADGDPAALPAARARWLEQAKKGDIVVEQKTDTLVSTLAGGR